MLLALKSLLNPCQDEFGEIWADESLTFSINFDLMKCFHTCQSVNSPESCSFHLYPNTGMECTQPRPHSLQKWSEESGTQKVCSERRKYKVEIRDFKRSIAWIKHDHKTSGILGLLSSKGNWLQVEYLHWFWLLYKIVRIATQSYWRRTGKQFSTTIFISKPKTQRTQKK